MNYVITTFRMLLLAFIVIYFLTINEYIPPPEEKDINRPGQLAAAYAILLALCTAVSIIRPNKLLLDFPSRLGINLMGASSGLLGAMNWVTSEKYASPNHILMVGLALLFATIAIIIAFFSQIEQKPSSSPIPTGPEEPTISPLSPRALLCLVFYISGIFLVQWFLKAKRKDR